MPGESFILYCNRNKRRVQTGDVNLESEYAWGIGESFRLRGIKVKEEREGVTKASWELGEMDSGIGWRSSRKKDGIHDVGG